MSHEKQQIEVKQMIETLVCEDLHDEKFCQYHRAVLELVSTAAKEGMSFLPLDLYCKYKGFVELSCKMFQKMQSDNQAELFFANWKDIIAIVLKQKHNTEYYADWLFQLIRKQRFSKRAKL